MCEFDWTEDEMNQIYERLKEYKKLKESIEWWNECEKLCESYFVFTVESVLEIERSVLDAKNTVQYFFEDK